MSSLLLLYFFDCGIIGHRSLIPKYKRSSSNSQNQNPLPPNSEVFVNKSAKVKGLKSNFSTSLESKCSSIIDDLLLN